MQTAHLLRHRAQRKAAAAQKQTLINTDTTEKKSVAKKTAAKKTAPKKVQSKSVKSVAKKTAPKKRTK